MKIEEFLQALVVEIDAVGGDVDTWTGLLAAPATDDAAFVDALESYCGQLERLGETCVMLGLGGLSEWCAHFSAGLTGMAQVAPLDRVALRPFAGAWCDLWRAYLADPAGFEPSMALIEHLGQAPAGCAPAEDVLLGLMEKLTLPPELPAELSEAAAQASADVEVTEADVSLVLADTTDLDVYTAFIDEAPDNATKLSTLMFMIADGGATAADVTQAKRIAHSFKGSANIVGIRGIAVMAHQAEDLLEFIERDGNGAPARVGPVLAEAASCIEQMVYALNGQEEAPPNAFDVLRRITALANAARRGDLAEMLDAVVAPAESAAAPVPAAAAADGVAEAGKAAPAEEKEASLRVPARSIDELLRLVGELTVRMARMDDQTRAATRGALDVSTQNLVLQAKIEELNKLVTIRGMAFRASDGAIGADPLELEQYNELYGIARAVQEAAGDVREMGQTLRADVGAMERELGIQAKLGRDLSAAVVGVRMLPASNLFPRLGRTVRQTVTATGKQAQFISLGGEIMIDSDMLAALADPLLHVLRNAVDHGIEPPAARLAAGKPESGTIDLHITRVGNSVTVRVRDDGAGLDLAAIRAKAVDRGLVDADAVLSDRDLAQIVLLPGFSTREQVTEVSGRGVGMDVVASRMRELNGTLDVHSEPGKGCTIELRFQASLVSQHALLVKAAGQTFALPSHLIVLGLASGTAEVVTEDAGHSVLALGEKWKVHSLAALAGFALPPDAAGIAGQSMVLFRSSGQSFALGVDRIEDSRELIIQPLPPVLKFLRGVSGAAILGNGSVAPLLDPAEIILRPLADLGISQSRITQMAEAARLQSRRVVVVDDSMSARKAVVQVLRDAGYEVADAVDGLAAIPLIVKLQPHAVVTDLEMPNMNGLELTGYLRATAGLTAIPVVMITSRTMARHREMADNAGVNAYLTKPYSDAELLATLTRLISAEAMVEAKEPETAPEFA